MYDEQGNIVPDAVEINNDVELFPLAPNTGEVTQPLEVIEEDEEEEEVVKEVFIDGATKGTHINSVEEGEEMVMEPFEESTLYDNEGNPITLSDIDEEQILILSSTGSEVSSSETIIQSSLVGNTDSILAHFPFNGDANDISGNGFHGDVYGAQLTTDRHGNADSAYFFDGQNDGIVIPGMQ